MKKLFLAFSTLFFTTLLSAQQQPDYAAIKLDKKEDYTAEVEKTVLDAASFLLSTSLDKDNETRLNSAQFLLRWMTGTPTYTFNIDEIATKISKDKEDLMIVYLAAMTKFCLEHPTDSKDTAKVRLETVRSVLDYCKQQGIKMTGQLKKLHQANDKGELELYLNKL